MNGQPEPKVDGRGFVTVDGVKIGKVVTGADGQPHIQLCDKNRYRSHQRGTRFVEVSIQSLQDAVSGVDKED